MGRREELLNAVREHALPLGPFGDPHERDRLEREWEDSLTEDDCLELLGWLREADWDSDTDRWTRASAQQIPYHVARAGCRCRGPRLLSLLLDLLGDPPLYSLAFDAVFGLEESAEYENLLVGTATRVVPINAELARVATPVHAKQLRRVACSPGCPDDVRLAVRDILCGIALAQGSPSAWVMFSPDWRTETARAIARQMAESRDFGAMPILADALQDAGCDNDDILNHCRDANVTHVRGCWIVDLVLGKE